MSGSPGLFVLAAAMAAVGLASMRIASRISERPLLRLNAAVIVAGAFITVEPMGLGLAGLGGNAWVTLGVAMGASGITMGTVGRPETPFTRQLARSCRDADRFQVLAAGGLAGTATLWAGFFAWNPLIGSDAETYHLAEPALWLHNGRPGSLVLTLVGLPVQAYPKGAEVLVTWLIAMARTPAVLAPLMAGLAVLTGVAVHVALRSLGVGRAASGMTAATLVFLPVFWGSINGPNTDPIGFAWLMLAACLCAGAREEPGLVWIGVLGAGLAVGTKSTTAVVAISLLVLALLPLRRAMPWRWPYVSAGLIGIGLAVIWPVQNLVTYGAPFYPFSSVPFGPPVPRVVTLYGASFLSDPSGALRVAGLSGYMRVGAGGFLMLAAVIPLAAWALYRLRSKATGGDSLVAVLVLVALVDVLDWGFSPFTGWSGHPGTESLVAGAVRYLLPAFAPAAAAVALASRDRRLRPICIAALMAAVGLDGWRLLSVGYPYRPPTWAIFVSILAGLGLVTWLRASPPQRLAVSTPYLLAGLLGVGAFALMWPTHRYLERHIALSALTNVDATAVLTWLEHRPGWVSGDAPVAVGPAADVSFMGPSFRHPLQVLGADTPCSEVRQKARTGWLILTATGGGVFGSPYPVVGCMDGYSPSFRQGQTSVYEGGPLTRSARG